MFLGGGAAVRRFTGYQYPKVLKSLEFKDKDSIQSQVVQNIHNMQYQYIWIVNQNHVKVLKVSE